MKNISVDLEREEKFLPASDVQSTLDAYEEYLREKDTTNKYRLTFTIHPFCSNVLFNRITEAVMNDKSDKCDLLFTEDDYERKFNRLNYDKTYYALKYGRNATSESTPTTPVNYDIRRLTRDTGYTSTGYEQYLTYYCGIDIFNNHILRKKSFICTNQPASDEYLTTRKYYNSIFDVVRNPYGTIESGLTFTTSGSTSSFHVYNTDSVYSFNEAINKNLKEENGWLGFTNQSLLKTRPRTFAPNNVVKNGGIVMKAPKRETPSEVSTRGTKRGGNIFLGLGKGGHNPFKPDVDIDSKQQYKDEEEINTITYEPINRIINSEDECTFIDLYPGKREFTFVPQMNTKRDRLEYNWDYCLTYPYKNITDNFLVKETVSDGEVNGIIADIIDLPDYTINSHGNLGDFLKSPTSVDFRTHVTHNLQVNDVLRISFVYIDKASGNKQHVMLSDSARVLYLGDNGYDTKHYFSISFEEIESELRILLKQHNVQFALDNGYFRIERVVADKPCKYYLRAFKKLPNFKNTNINFENGISEDDIDATLRKNDFNTSLNKLAFSKTIYGDDVAQIVYNDDIDVTGLYDNLGRELSEVYLTIIKTNRGHKEWYEDKVYGNSAVEISRCFGDVTSGFDLPYYTKLPEYSGGTLIQHGEYNVHKQHNIQKIEQDYTTTIFPETDFKIESGITINGAKAETNSDFDFIGDIVELDEISLEETVLEPIQYRFNTAQREILDDEYSALTVDNIVRDDSSVNKFLGETLANYVRCNVDDTSGEGVPFRANLAPEGYYYRAHYPVKLHEYDTTVNEGYHTQVYYTLSGDTQSGSYYDIITDRNYFFNVNDEVWFYENETNEKYVGYVTSVSGSDFTEIGISAPTLTEDIENYKMFKPNKIKPATAYELNDGTGKYIWRDFIPSSKIMRDSDLYDSIFTNGAIYLYKDINLYVKRQDPFGDFGLAPIGDNYKRCVDVYSELEILGENKDVTYGDYFEPGINNNC